MAEFDRKIVKEFGGPLGAMALMLWSHSVCTYFWLSIEYYNGGIFIPTDLSLLYNQLVTGLTPNAISLYIYFGFFFLQMILAAIMPGPTILGLPIPSENNKRLEYHCNALSSWYATISFGFFLHYKGILPLTLIADNLGRIMFISMVASDIIAWIVYFGGIYAGKAVRMSGNIVFDYFMGSCVNPRIFGLDLKMLAEIRWSWTCLFFLTLSALLKQQEQLGYVSSSMWLIFIAQLLYSNACMKGEECVPTTWDIFYEKWGWMLVFWNLAGVPFVYCFQSFYILKNNPQLPSGLVICLFVVLFAVYYIWDTSQSQRNRFRQQQMGTYVPRWAFPQLPWGTLENPKFIKAECGSTLLIDGWWKYARKIPYTCDFIFASIWGMSCGFSAILPYFYMVFFFLMILHRYTRDVKRCKVKYGKDWDKYCKAVPYVFIPGII